MRLIPNRRQASHFDLTEISVQELKNLLEAIKTPGGAGWRFNSPWGRGTIEQFESALNAERQYFYETSW